MQRHEKHPLKTLNQHWTSTRYSSNQKNMQHARTIVRSGSGAAGQSFVWVPARQGNRSFGVWNVGWMMIVTPRIGILG